MYDVRSRLNTQLTLGTMSAKYEDNVSLSVYTQVIGNEPGILAGDAVK